MMCDFKNCDNEAEIIRTFDAGYNASSKYALCNSHKVLEIFTKNVRDLRKACDSLLDNPRIKALGITSISGLITYCLRKELDRD